MEISKGSFSAKTKACKQEYASAGKVLLKGSCHGQLSFHIC